MNAKNATFVLLAMVLGIALVWAGYIPTESLMIAGAFGTLFSEGNRVGDWLKWEEDQRHSREEIVVLSGQNLKSGAVLGRTLVGATATAAAFAANTGNGVMGAITVTGAARRGTYKLIVIEPGANVGVFSVEDPDGKIIGRGNVASAFSAGGLAFTLADGATDFISGDGFDILVVAGSFKFKEYNPANVDGTQKVAGILFMDVNATAADTKGVGINRQAIVGANKLTWFAGATAAQITQGTDELAALGIISRTQV